MRLVALKFVLAALLLVPQLVSAAWWDDGWAYRKKITLNTSSTGANTHEALTDVPTLVRLHTGNFGFLDAKDDGGDVRFVAADDKTPLMYHIEHWDAVNELALVWVRVPKLSPASANEAIWMYYGNPKAVREDAPKSTYDAATALVLHFGGSAGAVVDSSPAQNAVANSGGTPLPQGPVDGALTFNGASELRATSSAALHATAQNGLTFAAWVRIPAPQSDAVVLSFGQGPDNFTVGIAGSKAFVRTGAARAQSTSDLSLAIWHHLAATLGGGKITLFIDGKPIAEAAAAPVDVQGDATVGTRFNGDVDEVQLHTVARSPDWIKTAWAGQGADATLLSLGQDEQAAGGGHSYFRILLGAVTLDGWVVIAILGVMMVISFAVMAGKGLLVYRTSRANRSFMEHFQKDPDAMLDPRHATRAPSAPNNSSLYRLYRVGLQQLAQRFTAYEQQGRPPNLSPQALGAIKASLDAGMVREGARLNRQMVLLTIAISGGPFLGLLGTVVGVMITFAAIAAAGDVNVNAIAPGIAAALVATVAGLAVAIPALFGYNYLASRIREVSNEMTV
ncbi:MAG: DUF2341 domain-containing protein, partial [Betaproteobacteria bacterium]